MDKKLKNLRSKMDGTVLRKGEVSEVDKGRIYQAVIHSKKPKRKVIQIRSCSCYSNLFNPFTYSWFLRIF